MLFGRHFRGDRRFALGILAAVAWLQSIIRPCGRPFARRRAAAARTCWTNNWARARLRAERDGFDRCLGSPGLRAPLRVTEEPVRLRAEMIASTATCTSPSVRFLKPTGMDNPEASCRWIWLSTSSRRSRPRHEIGVVLPKSCQETPSPSESEAGDVEHEFPREPEAVVDPVGAVRPGSFISPFQPATVLGFFKITRMTTRSSRQAFRPRRAKAARTPGPTPDRESSRVHDCKKLSSRRKRLRRSHSGSGDKLGRACPAAAPSRRRGRKQRLGRADPQIVGGFVHSPREAQRFLNQGRFVKPRGTGASGRPPPGSARKT